VREEDVSPAAVVTLKSNAKSISSMPIESEQSKVVSRLEVSNDIADALFSPEMIEKERYILQLEKQILEREKKLLEYEKKMLAMSQQNSILKLSNNTTQISDMSSEVIIENEEISLSESGLKAADALVDLFRGDNNLSTNIMTTKEKQVDDVNTIGVETKLNNNVTIAPTRTNWTSVVTSPNSRCVISEVESPAKKSHLKRKFANHLNENINLKSSSVKDVSGIVDNNISEVSSSTITSCSHSSDFLKRNSSSTKKLPSNNSIALHSMEQDEGEWNSQDDVNIPLPKPISKSVLTSSTSPKTRLPPTPPVTSTGQMNDIPTFLTVSQLNSMKWAELWKILEDLEWTWQKGRELIDFVYIRPGYKHLFSASKKNRFEAANKFRNSYFTSQDDVIAFIRQHIKVDSPIESAKKVEIDTSIKTHTPFVDQSKSFVVDNNSAIKKMESSISDSDSEPAVSQWTKSYVSCLTWKELWESLQKRGWTWDHGSGLITTLYLLPNIRKGSFEAQIGVNMLTSQEEVRDYVYRNYCSVEEDITANGNELNKSLNSSTKVESVEDWSLVKHRSKRQHVSHYEEDNKEHVCITNSHVGGNGNASVRKKIHINKCSDEETDDDLLPVNSSSKQTIMPSTKLYDTSNSKGKQQHSVLHSNKSSGKPPLSPQKASRNLGRSVMSSATTSYQDITDSYETQLQDLTQLQEYDNHESNNVVIAQKKVWLSFSIRISIILVINNQIHNI
jgi:hypothetical protein